jgi:hypothetical protein
LGKNIAASTQLTLFGKGFTQAIMANPKTACDNLSNNNRSFHLNYLAAQKPVLFNNKNQQGSPHPTFLPFSIG